MSDTGAIGATVLASNPGYQHGPPLFSADLKEIARTALGSA